jgi:hypothetical protein
MTPSIGRIVIYRQPDTELPINGTREHPAIVTRAWSERCVNLTVFLDGCSPVPVTSVERIDDGTPDQQAGWRWPERT